MSAQFRSLVVAALAIQFCVTGISRASELEVVTGEINNGLLTSGPPSVALFFTGTGTCTATLIGCQTALTAAHCVCDGGPCSSPTTGKALLFQHSGVYPIDSIAVHPDWSPNNGLGRHDLAVLKLAAPVAGVQPSLLNTSSKPALGTVATIVGFGATPTTPDGLKRQGQVQLSPCLSSNPGGLCYDFFEPIGPAGLDSTACPGDSGGPMFTAIGGNTVVSGVTSGGLGPGSSNCTAPLQGIYSDVFTDRSWIQSQAGSDLAQAACGSLPNAGGSLAPFASGIGAFSAAQSSATFTFEVAAGTTALHTFLNADDYLTNDFDLFINHGSPASSGSFDCKSELAGSIERCLVNNPTPGTWHLTVIRLAGAGVFQLTATAFKSASNPCIRDADTACLQNGRFEVNITWQNPQGSGVAQLMSFGGQRTENNESAFYSFQSPTNFEMGVKVLDACIPALGNRFWVFVSGLTDQGWVVTVRDTQNGATRTYSNPPGKLSSTFADTAAFACQ
jgi:Trypsin